MAVCPRCLRRKAKRHCPALEREICSVCCAEERLQTIACPEGCPHLGSEFYQQRRRKERAMARGREFLEGIQAGFDTREARDLAYRLSTDLYFFGRARGGVDDAVTARALRALPSALRGVIVPQGEAQALVEFLLERLRDPRRYPVESGREGERRERVLLRLAEAIEAGAPEGGDGRRHWTRVRAFFDELDVEADLDYSPDDPHPTEAPGPSRGAGGLDEPPERRSRGGIILP